MNLSPAVLALVLLAACAGNPLPEWKTNPTPSGNTKRVDHLERVSNSQIWRQSPYSRMDDAFDLPIYLIIAEDRTACIVPAEDWTIAAHGDLYPCPGKWRIARP